MKYIREFIKKHYLAIIVIMAFVLGFGGGLVGSVMGRAYLIDPSLGFLPFGNLDFSASKYDGQGLVISNAQNVIVQQDAKINETVNLVGSSLVGIYKKKPAPAKPSKVFTLENFYKINEPSGQGFIITSDGWIVTSLALVKNYNDYVVIAKDKKIYQIDKAATDSLTKFNFIHVSARDLPVRKLAETQDIKKGDLTVGVNWLGLNLISSISGFSESNGLVKSSDSFSRKIVLNDKPSAEFKGSVIFNLAGDALGLINDGGEVEPISHLSGAIKSLFKNKIGIRPSLGVNYINLAELAEAYGETSLWQKGVIIYKDLKAPAIKKNSPAERSGLREGDIIISVDGVELNKDNNLTEIIQDHLAGETVSLLVSRQGEEREIKVMLAELK
ncbi:MAG: PDZ domain-containing protein [bacterium]|nr:PDZ domain-containing protein [bacterium]